jgi:dTDP-4-dehydrorhamnose reductase
MKPTILIIGSNGLLGQKAVEIFKQNYQVITAGVEAEPFVNHGVPYHELDITDKNAVEMLYAKIQPGFVFNAAAYTQVDQAEIEKKLCYAVNVTGVKNLAEVSLKHNSKLVHISTDYVFDGAKGNYDENDETNPLGYYGYSKLKGEKAVLDSGCDAIIARTAVLFGYGVNIQMNFALWVWGELTANNPIRVVDDQIGNPTIADYLAKSVSEMLDKNATGLFHVAGNQPVSRYEFAKYIAEQFKLNPSLISRITSKDFPQRAPRPMDVSLNVYKIQNLYDIKLYTVKESLLKLKETLKN